MPPFFSWNNNTRLSSHVASSEDGWNRHRPQQGYLTIDLFRKLAHLAAVAAYPGNGEQARVDAKIGLRLGSLTLSEFIELKMTDRSITV